MTYDKLPKELKELVTACQKLRSQMIVDRNYAAQNGPQELAHNCNSYISRLDKVLLPFAEPA